MNIDPVPTSPKMKLKDDAIKKIYETSGGKLFEKPSPRQKSRLFVIFMILGGFVAGIFGETLINALAVIYPDLPVVSLLYAKPLPGNSSVIIQKEEKSRTAQELEVQNAVNAAKAFTVSIFAKKESTNEDGLLDASYRSEEKLGSGIILTNDGLIVTVGQVIDDSEKEYTVITPDGKQYKAAEIKFDNSTGAVFFRISAKNLPQAEFIDPADLHPATLLYGVNNKIGGGAEAFSAMIRDLNYADGDNTAFSSEIYPEKIRLALSLPEGFLGAPLVIANGKVCGLSVKNGEGLTELVLPANYLKTVLTAVIKNDAATRPYLGVHYLDLSLYAGVSPNSSLGVKEGALIYKNDNGGQVAVDKLSPAEKAGLKEGDVITKVGNIALNGKNLTEAVQDNEPGQKIIITYLRSGKEQNITVELGEVAE